MSRHRKEPEPVHYCGSCGNQVWSDPNLELLEFYPDEDPKYDDLCLMGVSRADKAHVGREPCPFWKPREAPSWR